MTATAEVSTGPTRPALSPRQIWVILLSLMLGTVLSAVDNTIVSTALPTIIGDLGGFSSYAWVGTAYILTSTIATPILGKLGDLFGRRRVMLFAIWMLLLGSLCCAAARNMPQLILARGLQGLGGGGIQALTFAILGDLVSPRERGRYMGAYTSIFVVSGIAGPLLGGWMIENFAWQWIFLVNLPVGLVAIAAIMLTLKLPFTRRTVVIDYLGAALLTACLSAVVLGLENGRSGWRRPAVFVAFAVALVALVGFLVQERRAKEPIIPLHLFRNRVFLVCACMGFLAGGLSYGTQSFLPLFFQSAQFTTATRAGLYLVPIMIGVMAGSTICGRRISSTGKYKRYPIITLCFTLVGSILLARISPTLPFWQIAIPMVAYGFGVGTTYTTTSIAMQNAIDHREIGIGTATLTSIRTLGGSFCLALFGTLHASVVTDELRRRVPASALPTQLPPTSLIRKPTEIQALPPATRQGVIEALTLATDRVFLGAVVLAVLAIAFALQLEERPLRR